MVQHDLGEGERIAQIPAGLSREYLLHHRVCPDRRTGGGGLEVAIAPGAFEEALDEIALLYSAPVSPRPVDLDELERMIERLAVATDAHGLPAGGTVPPESSATDIREIASQPPVIRYVNLLLRDAYDARASDVHLESTHQGTTVRLRIDGVLVRAIEPPTGLDAAVISRLKLLAELDIAERRRPQDGRIRVRLDTAELDLRVSTVPTVHGESVVLRLLDRGNRPVDLSELGMPDAIHAHIAEQARRAHGMILVTGPTGSGKTTTLYSALRRRDSASEKIITVEDPVEYQLDGVTQVPVHRQAGVTFASALRAILRQDPDVVMIGEMRDPETAEVATQAAMTGHLVFSTLHTNDAVGALPRLHDLGVAPYLIASTVSAVLAQRLVRRTCPGCAEPATADTAAIAELLTPRDVPASLQPSAPVVAYAEGRGCERCRHTGFRGRVGVFELVVITDELRCAIADSASQHEVRRLADAQGYRPMLFDGLAKAAAGLTTVAEITRVAHG